MIHDRQVRFISCIRSVELKLLVVQSSARTCWCWRDPVLTPHTLPWWPAGCAGAVVCADDEECADRTAREARAASPANFIWTQVHFLVFSNGLANMAFFQESAVQWVAPTCTFCC